MHAIRTVISPDKGRGYRTHIQSWRASFPLLIVLVMSSRTVSNVSLVVICSMLYSPGVESILDDERIPIVLPGSICPIHSGSKKRLPAWDLATWSDSFAHETNTRQTNKHTHTHAHTLSRPGFHDSSSSRTFSNAPLSAFCIFGVKKTMYGRRSSTSGHWPYNTCPSPKAKDPLEIISE